MRLIITANIIKKNGYFAAFSPLLLFTLLLVLFFLSGCLKSPGDCDLILYGRVQQDGLCNGHPVTVTVYPDKRSTFSDAKGAYMFYSPGSGPYHVAAYSGIMSAMAGPLHASGNNPIEVPDLTLETSGSITLSASTDAEFVLSPLMLSISCPVGTAVTFESVPAGRHALFASAPGYVRRGVYVTVNSSRNVDIGSVYLLDSETPEGRAWRHMRSGNFARALNILENAASPSERHYSGTYAGVDSQWRPLFKAISRIRTSDCHTAADELAAATDMSGEASYLALGLALATGHESLATEIGSCITNPAFLENALKARWGYTIEAAIPASKGRLLAGAALYNFIFEDDDDWRSLLKQARSEGLEDYIFDTINRLKW